MMEAQPLKGVMIGAGYFAAFQADAWHRVPGAEIVAVADADRTKAAEFAERWRIPRIYNEAGTMLRDEQAQFVDIVTRPETHVGLVSLAARHGVHAICQKPMAPTWAECRAMV